MSRIPLLCLAAMMAPLGAQNLPRLADGMPELGGKGVWHPRSVGDASRGDREVEVPLLPWAKLRFDENRASRQSDSTSRCLPPGLPRIVFTPEPFQIVQQPNRILFLYEAGAHVWRNVWMDGRKHPKNPNPTWLGDAVGHWEGDTLVVDAVGFNDKTWLDDAGHPHSEQLHIVERYTRTGALSMKYEVTIDDPGAYRKPWSNSVTIPFRPGEALQEFICLEGEHDARR